MNISVVSKYPPHPEGISDYGRHVTQALAARPEVTSVTVIANQTGEPDRSDGAVLVRRIWKPNDVFLVQRVTRELLRLRPNAVWFNISFAMFGDKMPAMAGFLLPGISRRLGARAVVTLHEFPNGRLAEIGIKDGTIRRAGLRAALALVQRADEVCVTIAGGTTRLEDRNSSNIGRFWHVPLCGYGEPTLAPFDGASTILLLTSHAPHKNVPLLLSAFRRVRARIPDARLILAGIDHPRFPGFLSHLRQSHGDQPGVEWRGPVATDEVPDMIRRAQLVVAPYSIATGSSATVHQAIGLGRPVVVTDLPEFRAVAEEENLWLEFFPSNDSGRLADALESLLRDPGRCRAMAEHNHRSATRHSLSATTDIYLRLLAGSKDFLPGTFGSSSSSGAQWQSTYRSS